MKHNMVAECSSPNKLDIMFTILDRLNNPDAIVYQHSIIALIINVNIIFKAKAA